MIYGKAKTPEPIVAAVTMIIISNDLFIIGIGVRENYKMFQMKVGGLAGLWLHLLLKTALLLRFDRFRYAKIFRAA